MLEKRIEIIKPEMLAMLTMDPDGTLAIFIAVAATYAKNIL